MSICSFRSKSRDLLAQNQVIDVYLWGATCLSAALGVRADLLAQNQVILQIDMLLPTNTHQ
jgi:hypothetical protein